MLRKVKYSMKLDKISETSSPSKEIPTSSSPITKPRVNPMSMASSYVKCIKI